VLWLTPVGVIVSITVGTVLGSTEQIGLVPPAAQTPKLNGCGVGAKLRTGGVPEPWPASATVNDQLGPTVPKIERGTTRVAVPVG
jgi:hypothetical protein